MTVSASAPATGPQARVLTSPEFYAEIAAVQPQVAVFDCDGTLWSGDAGSSFMWWTMENGILSAAKTAWLRERYDGYNRGDVSEVSICGEMVQVYAGIPVARMREAAAVFSRERIEAHIFPELQQVIANLQQAGTDIWAVSSTNDWVIEEGVSRFGIAPDRVLCARVADANGFLTEEIVDVPTDEGKVAALRRVGVSTADAVFGNSVHDAAMLAMARRAFPVNPTAALLERSAAEGWPVYWPASVQPGV